MCLCAITHHDSDCFKNDSVCALKLLIKQQALTKNVVTCFIVGNEPNMIRIQEPVIIIGDIHGQFYDMIHMFEKVVDPKGIPR